MPLSQLPGTSFFFPAHLFCFPCKNFFHPKSLFHNQHTLIKKLREQTTPPAIVLTRTTDQSFESRRLLTLAPAFPQARKTELLPLTTPPLPSHMYDTRNSYTLRQQQRQAQRQST